MPKPRPPRIEDFLDNDDPDLQHTNFDHIDVNPGVATVDQTGLDVSFEELLKFSFPDAEQTESITQIGKVEYIGDGVCKISGIDDARIEDIINVRTQDGMQQVLVLGVQEGLMETVVLGDYTKIRRGDQAVSSSAKLTVPAGPTLLGRVIDPLGEPIDGKGPIVGEENRNVEFPAPSVMAREPIELPMHTGIMVVDTTIPVGRGQRELVIGDRKTGKTRTVLDAISNQKGKNIICVYVGIGMQAAKAKEAIQLLTKRGAMEYTACVIAFSDDPPSLQYIAPYTGVAIAEYFMYRGQHALICYDDLSKQAKAYRQVSLLLKRSPGRDAYPGDIFFLHSRLLERAAKLHPKLGGGSITALPVAETQAGDVSEYIITNLMSITDGHIYLDANQMHEGILPAVNSGLSVSRIGGKIQVPLLRKVGELAGRQLARYNEVKSFETINTEVAEETLREIRRGKRVREMFAQDSSIALSADEQILFLGLVTTGRLDEMDLEELGGFKRKFLEYYRALDMADYKEKCQKSKQLEDIEPILDKLFSDYKQKVGTDSKYVVKPTESKPSATPPPTQTPRGLSGTTATTPSSESSATQTSSPATSPSTPSVAASSSTPSNESPPKTESPKTPDATNKDATTQPSDEKK